MAIYLCRMLQDTKIFSYFNFSFFPTKLIQLFWLIKLLPSSVKKKKMNDSLHTYFYTRILSM